MIFDLEIRNKINWQGTKEAKWQSEKNWTRVVWDENNEKWAWSGKKRKWGRFKVSCREDWNKYCKKAHLDPGQKNKNKK